MKQVYVFEVRDSKVGVVVSNSVIAPSEQAAHQHLCDRYSHLSHISVADKAHYQRRPNSSDSRISRI